MSTFKDFWSKKAESVSKEHILDVVKDVVQEMEEGKNKSMDNMINEESEGEEKYREMGDKFHEMADDEHKHKENLEDMNTTKAQEFSKPGPSIHTAKWDDCVKEVKAKGGANAYAVCTSQLGEESFKSQMTKEEIGMAKSELQKAIESIEKGDNYNYSRGDEVAASKLPKCPICGVRTTDLKHHMQENHPNEKLKAVDTSYAGGIPESLLARQDLEGETKKSFCPSCGLPSGLYVVRFDQENFVVSNKSQICKDCGNHLNKAFCPDCGGSGEEDEGEDCPTCEGTGQVKKGAIEQTGKQLNTVAEKAEDAESIEEKQDLVSRLKAIQIKRQKAEISARKSNDMKSFKSVWSGMKKGGPGSGPQEGGGKSDTKAPKGLVGAQGQSGKMGYQWEVTQDNGNGTVTLENEAGKTKQMSYKDAMRWFNLN